MKVNILTLFHFVNRNTFSLCQKYFVLTIAQRRIFNSNMTVGVASTKWVEKITIWTLMTLNITAVGLKKTPKTKTSSYQIKNNIADPD